MVTNTEIVTNSEIWWLTNVETVANLNAGTYCMCYMVLLFTQTT